jgi:hypothetical protein
MAALAAGVLLAASGCDRDDEVRAYPAPKAPSPATAPVVAAASAGSSDAAGAGVEWTLPAGWQRVAERPMSFATFAVAPETPDVVLTLSQLPNSPVPANVNRWEEQLGLPRSSEADVAKMTTHVDVGDAHVDTFDLTGPEAPDKPRQRMLAAIIPRGRSAWFLKLVGPAETVAAQKANFDAFVRSLRFAAPPDEKIALHDEPAPAPPGGSSFMNQGLGPRVETPATLTFAAPPGWAQDASPKQMRAYSFQIKSGDEAAEVVLTRLPSAGIGSLPDNINRWRGQVGLGPVTDISPHLPPRKFDIGGQGGAIFDLDGPGDGGGKPAQRLLVALAPEDEAGHNIWFFKLQGPASLVGAQKDAFETFLKSVRFGGDAR